MPTIAHSVFLVQHRWRLFWALLIHGLVPGPEMLTENLDVTYTLVWSVAISTFSVLVVYVCQPACKSSANTDWDTRASSIGSNLC